MKTTAARGVIAKTIRIQRHQRSDGILAAISGLLAAMLALVVPFLPIEVNDVSLTWPQGSSAMNVIAPLVAYTPVDVHASVPCSVAARGSTNAGGAVIASTIPVSSPNAQKNGLLISAKAGGNGDPARLRITLRNIAILDVPLNQLAEPDCLIRIASTATETSTTVDGAAAVTPLLLSGDYRPQLVGIFSDLKGPDPTGLTITARIDNRFDSTPAPIKVAAAVMACIAMLLSLILLARMDGYAPRHRWWDRLLRPRISAPDVVVAAILLLWHIIGANTADDGYQLGMARASTDAGYIANYFRYFGVPETPFGTPYYNLFALLTHVSTASVWMRLPALVLALTTWWLISAKVLPRLGAARGARLPVWGAALVFLAFWLPYNNGLRPEPVVAFGVVLTWWMCEHAVATRRIFPIAAAILTAAFTLTAGPSGLICMAALIAASRPIIAIIRSGIRERGYLPVLGPLLAAGLIVLVAVFADQPLAAVIPMIRAHDAAGPSLPWFQEYLRYQYLLQDTVDGSPARRFGVFVMIAAVVAATAVLLRRGGIPGLASGPTRRLLGVTAGAMVLMMFTPTKWTHHFGVFAGLAGCVAAILVVAIGPTVLRSRRNQALATAGTAFLMALVLTSRNGYWYVSTWGVPWFDKAPSIHGFGIATVFRGFTVIALVAALWFHVNDRVVSIQPDQAAQRLRWRRASPVVIAAAFMVVLEVASLAKAAVAQYPAYSIARSNVDAILGHPCGLADDVLVETDPNASLLQPVGAHPGTALNAGGSSGFTPNGVAADLTSDEALGTAGTANSVATAAVAAVSPTNSAGTGGGRGARGINGSSVALPFGLDPRTTPVLGSFAATSPASITTAWYRLPAPDSTGYRGDLVAIAVAGRIRSVDRDGIATYGQELHLELGATTPHGDVVSRGVVTPIDIGPAPSWRNLRVPMSDIPSDADVVRIVAADTDLDPNQWLAITPPRVPRTTVLNTLVGSSTPVMIDWAVGLNFPCQHLLTLRDGVMQVPRYRILPDRRGAQTTNLWQDAFGGGPLGWIDALLTAETLPSYLRGDLRRDWGELEQYRARIANTNIAQIRTRHIEHKGLWSPAPIKTD